MGFNPSPDYVGDTGRACSPPVFLSSPWFVYGVWTLIPGVALLEGTISTANSLSVTFEAELASGCLEAPGMVSVSARVLAALTSLAQLPC